MFDHHPPGVGGRSPDALKTIAAAAVVGSRTKDQQKKTRFTRLPAPCDAGERVVFC